MNQMRLFVFFAVLILFFICYCVYFHIRTREKGYFRGIIIAFLLILVAYGLTFEIPNTVSMWKISFTPNRTEKLAKVANELVNIVDLLQKQDSIWIDAPQENNEIEKRILKLQDYLHTEFNRDESLLITPK